ncbi:MAG: glycosyltransferase [Flavobacterium sp.]|nr:MAG: glycosyltransferase [Flavobacterium sp.]
MKFSLIICTYMRAEALLDLLKSVALQTLYPSEILIIDGSTNDETGQMLQSNAFENLKYFLASSEHRGLTRQRNFGIAQTSGDIEIICFLDDDTVLETDYFEKLIGTYQNFPNALGVGGYITNEVSWQKVDGNYQPSKNEFVYDGWKRTEPQRFRIRNKFGLNPNVPPGFSPDFSHGRSLSFLPPSGKTYPVEQLMGGVSSFRKPIFKQFSFSHYFEGYGLYEDADFTLRVSKTGPLYCNTSARLGHYHHESGRPNQYRYGKMVVRNGWYVWRVKNPKPSFKARLKWHATTFLLAGIRFNNIFTTAGKKAAFTESAGRIAGWFSLVFNRPENKYVQKS